MCRAWRDRSAAQACAYEPTAAAERCDYVAAADHRARIIANSAMRVASYFDKKFMISVA
jgi:hypothetical protein